MELVVHGQIRAGKLLWRPSAQNHAVTVVCKVSFDLRPDVSPIANTQHPVVEADVYGARGGMLLATDLVPFKKRPEVLVIGSVHAYEGRPVPSLLARLAMHEIDKSVLVVGDRQVNRIGQMSEPVPFARMPLVWDRASGGPNTYNPVGKPFGMAPSADSQAPNLYPADAHPLKFGPIAPVSLGPIAPNWPTRMAFLRQRAANWDFRSWTEQPLPTDIDIEYLNAAPQDQQRSTPFGEDAIYLQHLHPHHAQLSTRLAPVNPMVTVDRGAGAEQLKLRCDTMVIDTDRSLVMLVWRAHVVLEHPAQMCKIVVIGPTGQTATPVLAHDDLDDEATLIPTRPFKSRAATAPLPERWEEKTTGFPGAESISDGIHTVMGNANAAGPALPFDPSRKSNPQLFSALAPPQPAPADSDIEATMAPMPGPRAPALPFGSNASATPAPAPLNTTAVEAAPDHSDLDGQTAYLAAGQSTTGIVLPFAASPNVLPTATIERLVAENPAPPRPMRDNSDLEGETAFIPTGQARSSVVLPFGSNQKAAPAPAAVVSQSPPMTIGQLAAATQHPEKSREFEQPATPIVNAGEAKAPAAEPTDKVQVILRAIWKGDRTQQEVLAEHGLTELQWRAMKRNAAKTGKG